MSAIGPKRTSIVAPHMSAFGCKADMPFCTAHVCLTQSGHSPPQHLDHGSSSKNQINGGNGARRLGMIKPKLTTSPMLANIVTRGFEGSMNPLEATSLIPAAW